MHPKSQTLLEVHIFSGVFLVMSSKSAATVTHVTLKYRKGDNLLAPQAGSSENVRYDSSSAISNHLRCKSTFLGKNKKFPFSLYILCDIIMIEYRYSTIRKEHISCLTNILSTYICIHSSPTAGRLLLRW